jgi:serine/threonine protein phosphatase PrpC
MEVQTRNLHTFIEEITKYIPDDIKSTNKRNIISNITKTWNTIVKENSNENCDQVKYQKISKEVFSGLKKAYNEDETKLNPLYKSLEKRDDFFYVNRAGGKRVLKKSSRHYILIPSQGGSYEIMTRKGDNIVCQNSYRDCSIEENINQICGIIKEKTNKKGIFGKLWANNSEKKKQSAQKKESIHQTQHINRHEHPDPKDVRNRLNKNKIIAANVIQPPTIGAGKLHENYNEKKRILEHTYDIEPGVKWKKIKTAEIEKKNQSLDREHQAKKESIKALKGVGIAHMVGERHTQEDEHAANRFSIDVHGVLKEIKLAGMFDGHGGSECSAFVAANLQKKIEEILPEYLEKYAEEGEDVAIYNALKIAFADLADEYKRLCLSGKEKFEEDYSSYLLFCNGQEAGTTACIAMFYNDHLWIANVGDSRAVICQNGRATTLSQDAEPKIERFKRGVEKRGAHVEGNRVDSVATARAIGDFKITGINPRPKIVDLNLNELQKILNKEGDPFLVIACDGLWDVASSEQVAETMAELEGTPADKAEFLIKKAYASGSKDNISAIVIDLKKFIRIKREK